MRLAQYFVIGLQPARNVGRIGIPELIESSSNEFRGRFDELCMAIPLVIAELGKRGVEMLLEWIARKPVFQICGDVLVAAQAFGKARLPPVR